MTFADLKPFQRFEFVHHIDLTSGIARGPWVKITERTYRHEESTSLVHRVGTKKVEVEALEPSIDQIETERVWGNANDDGPLLSAVHWFLMSEHKPMDERIRALKVLDKIIGEPGTQGEAGVLEYVKDTTELLAIGPRRPNADAHQEQMDSLHESQQALADYVSWSGGFEPEDEFEIKEYLTAQFGECTGNPDRERLYGLLTEWLTGFQAQQDADKKADDIDDVRPSDRFAD